MLKFFISILVVALLYAGGAFMMLKKASITDLILDSTCNSAFSIPVPSYLYLRKFKKLSAIAPNDKKQTLLQFILAGFGDKKCDNERILKLVDLFLNLGFDINQHGPNGLTVLHDAIIWNDQELVQHLIDRGANPKNITRKPYEPEFLTAFELNKEIMLEELSYAERIKIQTIMGQSSH